LVRTAHLTKKAFHRFGFLAPLKRALEWVCAGLQAAAATGHRAPADTPLPSPHVTVKAADPGERQPSCRKRPLLAVRSVNAPAARTTT
jgi:hypothetical protein